MNILVAVEEFRVGGAQTFALRLAQALHEAGHRVYLYNMYWQFTEHDLVKRLAPNVELLQFRPANGRFDNLLFRGEDWFQRRGWDVRLRSGRLRRHLRQVIADKKIEVISSNTFKCDYLQAQALQVFPKVPLVVTMHGDYEQFLAFYQQHTHFVIPNYPQKLAEAIGRINGIAYLSDQNLEVLKPEVVATSADHIHVRRIYNGLNGQFSSEASQFTRESLRIEANALVFGMVARGVPEKGWVPVIEAYQRLRQEMTRPVHLVLVGASPFLDELRETHRADSAMHFLGFVNNPVDCAASFDVGILASSLKESLPNSIAEYLFCGKAVISTDIGEIRQMVRTDNGEDAGLLIAFPQSGLADAGLLYQAMRRYAFDDALLLRHQALAREAFEKFDMNRCVQSYVALYRDCVQALAG